MVAMARLATIGVYGFDAQRFLSALPERGAAALFCVEADPEACHRSLVADRMAAEHGVKIVHLRPDSVTGP